MPVLECDKVGLRAGSRQLLRDVSFSLESGEILGVAGRNGAGKSSLLRIAGGETLSTSGSVRLHGRALAEVPPRERARQLAILPQSSSLQFDYSVRELVSLGRIPHGSRDDIEIVRRLIEQCELSDHADQSYLTLSGGERQRAQLARVLAQLLPRGANGDLRGQLLLLDEPTNALDLPHQEHFLAMLLALRERGCAILLVLHDISLLSRCADRLLFLHDGGQMALGTTDALLNETQLSALYDYPLQVLPLAQDRGIQIAPHPHAPGP
jgi:iron complex transport system ATP-binding protein